MKGYFKHLLNFTPIWPLRDLNRKVVNSLKNLSRYFPTSIEFKTTNNSISPRWHLSTCENNEVVDIETLPVKIFFVLTSYVQVNWHFLHHSHDSAGLKSEHWYFVCQKTRSCFFCNINNLHSVGWIVTIGGFPQAVVSSI